MPVRFAMIATLLLFAANAITVTDSAAAELAVTHESAGGGSDKSVIVHRYVRLWPQDCFLMPDVIVAVDALGPYCSSPRGYYFHYRRR
jgi:hypothetical protein